MTTLGDLAWPAVDAAALLVVPLGATEQHGPHLPLSTDTDIAVALAGRLPRVTVAPALAYGASGEHADFAGTLSIGTQALTLVLVELVRSARLTWSRVLLLTGHGGNAEAVSAAVSRLREEGHDVRAWGPRWDGDAHAGCTETSVQLALDPRRVQSRLARAGATAPVSELLPDLRRGGVRAVSSNGVLGDPAGASAELGERLLASAARELRAFVEAWP